MSREVKLPSLGETVEAGTVLQVLVSEGDHVDEQDPLLELETDKATVEVPSPTAGTIEKVLVSEGDEVESGQPICRIDDGDEAAEEEPEEEPDEETEEPEPEERSEDTEEEPAEAEESTPAEAGQQDEKEQKKEKRKKSGRKERKRRKSEAPEPTAGAEDAEGETEPERRKTRREKTRPPAAEARPTPRLARAAPHVRRLARELGVDLDEVAAARADQITEEDVKSHVRAALSRAGVAEESRAELPDFSKWGEVERMALGAVRRTTAATVSDSWKTVPQVTHFDRAAVSGLESFRSRYEGRVDGERISLTAILMKLVAEAVARFEQFNSSIDMSRGELVVKRFVHVGVAVDTPRGLLVPVVRDVQDKDLVAVSQELAGLLEATRSGDVAPDDLAGATITVTNVGTIGGSHFTPLVVWPQVAILGVGAVEPVLVERDDEVVVESVLPLSLSYDHRAIDGADAARFTRWLVEAIENPLTLLLDS